MIKKLKLGFLIAILSLTVGVSSANAADLSFDTATTVTVNGNDYFIGSGSGATSVVVAATTLTVIVPASTTFTLVSPGRHTLTNDGGLTAVCTNSESTLTISTASTVIITPSTTACGAISGGGGGGGGGGGTVTPVVTITPVVVVPTVPTTPTVTPTTSVVLKALPYASPKTVAEIQANLSVLLENVAMLQATLKASVGTGTATGTSVPPSGSYKVGLTPGSKGNDVTALQNFLKSQGADIYPEGLVTGFYGNLTKAAVAKFQMKHGIVTSVNDGGYGNVGPKTRAKINQLLGL